MMVNSHSKKQNRAGVGLSGWSAQTARTEAWAPPPALQKLQVVVLAGSITRQTGRWEQKYKVSFSYSVSLKLAQTTGEPACRTGRKESNTVRGEENKEVPIKGRSPTQWTYVMPQGCTW